MAQLDYENAYDYMLKSQAVGASGPDFQLQLTNLNAKLNNWSAGQYAKEIDKIIEQYPQAAFQTMVNLYQSISMKMQSRGKVRDHIPYTRQFIQYGGEQLGPGIGAFLSVDLIHSKIILGDTQGAEEELNNILEMIVVPPLNNLMPLIECCYYSSMKNWDKFNENFKRAQDGAIAIGYNLCCLRLI